MSDTPWTPGKWTAIHHGKGSMAYRVTVKPGDVHGDICNVIGGLAAQSVQVVAANARLIAEAPTMYAALDEALIKIENDRTMWSEEWLIWATTARATLAKARGDA